MRRGAQTLALLLTAVTVLATSPRRAGDPGKVLADDGVKPGTSESELTERYGDPDARTEGDPGEVVYHYFFMPSEGPMMEVAVLVIDDKVVGHQIQPARQPGDATVSVTESQPAFGGHQAVDVECHTDTDCPGWQRCQMDRRGARHCMGRGIPGALCLSAVDCLDGLGCVETAERVSRCR